VEGFLDRMVGLGLLRDMAEFFQAFGPLFEGFRERALAVQELLRSRETGFLLVSGPGPEPIPDTMFFARRLGEAGYDVGPVVVNRLHPESTGAGALARWLGERDRRGLEELAALLPGAGPIAVPLLPRAPIDISSLAALSRFLDDRSVRPSPD
jgi:anion-transporting  ArsA/GET3 family ATPase